MNHQKIRMKNPESLLWGIPTGSHGGLLMTDRYTFPWAFLWSLVVTEGETKV